MLRYNSHHRLLSPYYRHLPLLTMHVHQGKYQDLSRLCRDKKERKITVWVLKVIDYVGRRGKIKVLEEQGKVFSEL